MKGLFVEYSDSSSPNRSKEAGYIVARMKRKGESFTTASRIYRTRSGNESLIKSENELTKFIEHREALKYHNPKQPRRRTSL